MWATGGWCWWQVSGVGKAPRLYGSWETVDALCHTQDAYLLQPIQLKYANILVAARGLGGRGVECQPARLQIHRAPRAHAGRMRWLRGGDTTKIPANGPATRRTRFRELKDVRR